MSGLGRHARFELGDELVAEQPVGVPLGVACRLLCSLRAEESPVVVRAVARY